MKEKKDDKKEKKVGKRSDKLKEIKEENNKS